MSELKDNRQSMGGKARAKSLTVEQRKAQARKAARARWDANIPEAVAEATFPLAERDVSAAVLPNGKRLITQATFYRALGRSRSPKAGKGVLTNVDGKPFFLSARTLEPFIDEDLLASTTPVFYLDFKRNKAVGYDAELLPRVANVYLKYRDKMLSEGEEIPAQYQHIVEACDRLMRGLAHVGIVALIDEATGYQDIRSRDALAKILERFLDKEARKYLPAFSLDYFEQLCKLKGVEFDPSTMQMPPYFGHYTNDIVWSRIAPGVLDKLRELNPRQTSGRRRWKHHQFASENIGLRKLTQHLGSVVTLMKLADGDWDRFKAMLDKVHPPWQDPKDIPLFASLLEGEVK